MFPSFSDLCTDTFRTHCTILWEKLSGETVLSGAVLTVIADVSLIRWNCTVSWLPSKKSETSFYFRKVKIMTKVVVKKKKNHCGFLARLRLQLSSFHWRKIILCIRLQFPSSQKHVSQQFHIYERNSSESQCHAMRSMSREIFLWILTIT